MMGAGVAPGQALSVSLAASVPSVTAGDSSSRISYTAQVDNTSTLPADFVMELDASHVDCSVDSCPAGDCGDLLSGTVLTDTLAADTSTQTYIVSCGAAAGATSSLTAEATIGNSTGSETASVNVAVEQQADLSISKDDGEVFANFGSDLTYSIEVTNNGPSDALGSIVRDEFPIYLGSCNITCETTGGCTAQNEISLLEQSLDLLAGETITLQAVCTTFFGLEVQIENTATITAPTGVMDPDSSNNSATDQTMMGQQEADVQVTMDDGVTAVVEGDRVIYNIQVSNPSGPFSAAVTVRSPVTSVFGLENCTATRSSDQVSVLTEAGDLEDQVMSLEVGGLALYTVECDAPEVPDGQDSALMINTVVLTPNGTVDPVAGNNSATDSNTVTPRQADLSITATAAPSPALPGATITYSAVVVNAGAQIPETVTVNATLPSTAESTAEECTAVFSESFEEGDMGGWQYTEGGNLVRGPTKRAMKASDWCCQPTSTETISCEIASLGVETSPILELTTTLPTDASDTASADFTVSASEDVEDPDTTNNSATVTSEVGEPLIDLGLELSASPDPVATEATLTYTLVVTNAGPSAASTVEVTSYTSFETDFVSATVDAGEACNTGAALCSEAEGQVDCCFASLEAEGTVTITLVTTVIDGATGTITHSAQVDASETDTNASNDSTTVNTTVDG